jgi:hypothetical protein
VSINHRRRYVFVTQQFLNSGEYQAPILQRNIWAFTVSEIDVGSGIPRKNQNQKKVDQHALNFADPSDSL